MRIPFILTPPIFYVLCIYRSMTAARGCACVCLAYRASVRFSVDCGVGVLRYCRIATRQRGYTHFSASYRRRRAIGTRLPCSLSPMTDATAYSREWDRDSAISDRPMRSARAVAVPCSRMDGACPCAPHFDRRANGCRARRFLVASSPLLWRRNGLRSAARGWWCSLGILKVKWY